jgi:hypothetical protein
MMTRKKSGATQGFPHPDDWSNDQWGSLHLENGCEANPIPLGCLTCPLPQCKYDDQTAYQTMLKVRRHQAILDVYREMPGYPTNMERVEAVAKAMNITGRTVYRIVALAAQGADNR